MRKALSSIILTSVITMSSSLALATLSFDQSEQLASSSQTSLQLSQDTPEKKYCRVVRNSLYGKFRRKCRTASEWETWIAKYVPKIKKQWKTAGLTSNVKHGRIFDSNTYVPTDPIIR